MTTSSMPTAAVRSNQVRSVGTIFLRVRPWVVGPALVVGTFALFASGAPSIQLAITTTLFVAMFAFFAAEAYLARRTPVDEAQLARSLAITLAGIATVCLATGGIDSPLLPMLFAPTVIAFAAFGRGSRSSAFFVALVLLVIALTLLPREIPFAPPRAPFVGVMRAIGVIVAAILLRIGVSGLSDAFVNASDDLLAARARALEIAESRARALETHGARVAHEIKNPLSAVRGLVELIGEDAADSATQKRTEVIVTEVDRIERLLREYLSFSRPFSTLSQVECDLSDLVNETLALLALKAEKNGVSLICAVESRTLMLDTDAMKQVLFNLIANAIEAAPNGQVKITLDAHESATSLTIADDGRGMSPDDLSRLGTPFFTTRDGGTGLGVVIARTLIEQHGGTLSFTSEIGRGTIACVSFRA